MRMYSLHDTKAGRFTPPFLASSDEEAKRIVYMTASTGQASMLSQFPGDFTLYMVGTWDEDNGTVVPVELENLGNAFVIMNHFRKNYICHGKDEEGEQNERD